jgi:hypothetical protein
MIVFTPVNLAIPRTQGNFQEKDRVLANTFGNLLRNRCVTAFCEFGAFGVFDLFGETENCVTYAPSVYAARSIPTRASNFTPHQTH